MAEILQEAQKPVPPTDVVRAAVTRMLQSPRFFSEEQRAALRSCEGTALVGNPDGSLPDDIGTDVE